MHAARLSVALILSFLTVVALGKTKIDPEPATVAVDCNAGQSLNTALTQPANRLTIEFTGTCTEDLDIRRGNVALVGLDASATVQGSVSVRSFGLSDDLLIPGSVHLDNLSIIAGGLEVSSNRLVVARTLSVTQSPGDGIHVLSNATLRCADCTSTDNGGSGMQAQSGGVIELAGTTQASNNGLFGLNVFAGGDVVVEDRDGLSANPTSLTTNGNQNQGVSVANGASFTLGADTTLTSNGNPQGVVIGTGGSAFLIGTTNVSGNGRGLWVIAGKLLAFGPVNAIGNTENGLRSERSGRLRLGGGGEVSGSQTGAFTFAGHIELFNVTFSGNGTDIQLFFDSNALIAGGTPVPACDSTSSAFNLSTLELLCPVEL